MCYVDLDPADVFVDTQRRARKHHTCSCCGRAIVPGETYTKHFQIFEGDRHEGKACAQCQAAREEFAAAHEGGLCAPSYLVDLLVECIADDDEESERRWKPLLSAIRARHGVSLTSASEEAP